MHFVAEFVDAVEATVRHRIEAGHMIAVIGEMLAGCQTRGFPHDFVALDDELGAVAVFDHPFAAQQRDRPVGTIADRDEIDERVRLVRRQTCPTVVVAELVEPRAEAGKFLGGSRHRSKEVAECARRKRASGSGAALGRTGRLGFGLATG